MSTLHDPTKRLYGHVKWMPRPYGLVLEVGEHR